ncbi:MAG: rRNA pseudouridine synthase [Desulfobacterales bacterium]|nr:rRNA pseudouridine synthase [Desulfobacterales bacterium]
MALVRLQKFLSAAGVCSRRRGEEYIRDGRVRVNGDVVTTPGSKVDPGKDRVEVDGKVVEAEREMVYIALNKPVGYVTSCRHPDEKTVVDLVDYPGRVYPVGRLDKDSTGLLLLTNDGRLHHRLCHPSFDHEKEYDVTVKKPMSGGALKKMAAGLLLNGKKTRPARVKKISSRRFRIVLKEGRNRQIRRMVQKVGNRVTALTRIRVVNIRLGGLAKGAWRFLSKGEVEKLKNPTANKR